MKNKNLLEINGIPLVGISVIQALKSKLFDVVAVSSDSKEILDAAKKSGATLLIERPAELATDTAGKIPAIQHAAREVESRLKVSFDIFVDLDSTSPLRNVADINGAVQLLENSNCSNVITGAAARRSPYFNLVEEHDGFVRLSKQTEKPVLRRQDAPKCFDMNASIYAWKRVALLNATKLFYTDTKIYEMPEERSLDIDSQLDLEFVRFISEQHKRFENEW